MSKTTNLEETYELLSNKETTTEIVTTDGTSLTAFVNLYNDTARTMTELCVMASKLAKVDRKTFKEYVTTNLALSPATVTVIIKAGDLYNNHIELLEMNYTKVYELQPVNEQLDEFVETVGGYDALKPMSQVDIRNNVKNFLREADEENEMVDDTEDDTEPTEEQTPDLIDNSLLDGLQFTADYLGALSEGDELDADDIQSFKYIIKTISKIIKGVN